MAWNKKSISKTFFFSLRKANRKFSQWRFAVFSNLLAPPSPNQWETISLHTRRGKMLRKHWQVSWPHFSARGTLCCHLVADLRHSKLAAEVLFELGCGQSCGLACILIELCCQPCNFFPFSLLMPIFNVCLLALHFMCLQRLCCEFWYIWSFQKKALMRTDAFDNR